MIKWTQAEMLMKICNRCGKKIKQGETCECVKKRHKIYNEEYRDRVKNTFYHSKAWERVSKMAKARANGLDEYALEYGKRILKGKITHHIFELDERPDLCLSMENLIYVSAQTHNRIHTAYKQNEETRIEMQKRLMAIREK